MADSALARTWPAIPRRVQRIAVHQEAAFRRQALTPRSAVNFLNSLLNKSATLLGCQELDRYAGQMDFDLHYDGTAVLSSLPDFRLVFNKKNRNKGIASSSSGRSSPHHSAPGPRNGRRWFLWAGGLGIGAAVAGWLGNWFAPRPEENPPAPPESQPASGPSEQELRDEVLTTLQGMAARYQFQGTEAERHAAGLRVMQAHFQFRPSAAPAGIESSPGQPSFAFWMNPDFLRSLFALDAKDRRFILEFVLMKELGGVEFYMQYPAAGPSMSALKSGLNPLLEPYGRNGGDPLESETIRWIVKCINAIQLRSEAEGYLLMAKHLAGQGCGAKIMSAFCQRIKGVSPTLSAQISGIAGYLRVFERDRADALWGLAIRHFIIVLTSQVRPDQDVLLVLATLATQVEVRENRLPADYDWDVDSPPRGIFPYLRQPAFFNPTVEALRKHLGPLSEPKGQALPPRDNFPRSSA